MSSLSLFPLSSLLDGDGAELLPCLLPPNKVSTADDGGSMAMAYRAVVVVDDDFLVEATADRHVADG